MYNIAYNTGSPENLALMVHFLSEVVKVVHTSFHDEENHKVQFVFYPKFLLP